MTSRDFAVYLPRRTMPSAQAWHEAIVEAGHPLLLDPDFDVDAFEGFLPCRLLGATTGFEYYGARISSHRSRELRLPRKFDFSVCVLAGENPTELVAALAAVSVLAHVSGGTIEDPKARQMVPADSAMAWGKLRLRALTRHTGHSEVVRHSNPGAPLPPPTPIRKSFERLGA